MAWLTEDDLKGFIHDWDSYGFTQAQIDSAIENAEARIKDRLAPYFTLPLDTEAPPEGLKSIIAQYAAYLLMRARRVALTEAEEAWVRELGDEVEEMLDKLVKGELAIRGLSKQTIEGGEKHSKIESIIDPLFIPFRGEKKSP